MSALRTTDAKAIQGEAMTDIAGLVTTLRANDFDDAADRIEALQAEVDRQVSKNLIDLVRHREDADRRVAEERERIEALEAEVVRLKTAFALAIKYVRDAGSDWDKIQAALSGAQVERLSQPSPLKQPTLNPMDGCPFCEWVTERGETRLDEPCELHQKITDLQQDVARSAQCDRDWSGMLNKLCDVLGGDAEDDPLRLAQERMDELRAHEETQPSDGWQLVPKEPTRDMIGEVVQMYGAMIDGSEWPFTRNLYRAMLASAPPAPISDGWQMKRIAILEDRIRYAIDLVDGGYVGEATYELDRALNDPDMLASTPPAPSQPSPVVTEEELAKVLYAERRPIGEFYEVRDEYMNLAPPPVSSASVEAGRSTAHTASLRSQGTGPAARTEIETSEDPNG